MCAKVRSATGLSRGVRTGGNGGRTGCAGRQSSTGDGSPYDRGMDLDFAILSDGVTVRQDGKMDIYGAAWDTVFARAVPATHPQITLAVRVLCSRHELEHDHHIDVVLQGADGVELARAHGDMPALSDEQRAVIPAGRQVGLGLVLNFQNVLFPAYGAYQIAIHWDGTEARPPLRLFVADLETLGAGTPPPG